MLMITITLIVARSVGGRGEMAEPPTEPQIKIFVRDVWGRVLHARPSQRLWARPAPRRAMPYKCLNRVTM